MSTYGSRNVTEDHINYEFVTAKSHGIVVFQAEQYFVRRHNVESSGIALNILARHDLLFNVINDDAPRPDGSLELIPVEIPLFEAYFDADELVVYIGQANETNMEYAMYKLGLLRKSSLEFKRTFTRKRFRLNP